MPNDRCQMIGVMMEEDLKDEPMEDEILFGQMPIDVPYDSQTKEENLPLFHLEPSTSTVPEAEPKEETFSPKRKRTRLSEIVWNLKFHCPICETAFSSVEMLDYHLDDRHHQVLMNMRNMQMKQPFICSSCDLSFMTLNYLYNHWYSLEKNHMPCNGTLVVLQRQEYLDAIAVAIRKPMKNRPPPYRNTSLREKQQPSQAPYLSKSERPVVHHYSRKEFRRKCHCASGSCTANIPRGSADVEDEDVEDDPSRIFAECGWLSDDERPAMKRLFQPVRCPKCQDMFGSFFTLDAHIKMNHMGKGLRVFMQCSGCGGIFDNAELLRRHLLTQYHSNVYKCFNQAAVVMETAPQPIREKTTRLGRKRPLSDDISPVSSGSDEISLKTVNRRMLMVRTFPKPA